MRQLLFLLTGVLFAVTTPPGPVSAADRTGDTDNNDGNEAAGYIFAWPFIDAPEMTPRGGITRGAPVTLADGPGQAWQRLQSEDIPAQERDRRAILALTGDYRTSFDFLETVIFEAPFEPAQPYRSWATERVYVLASEPDFVSLQHIMVMFFADEDGNVQGPVVQKHWRHDWHFEPETIVEFVGDRIWEPRPLSTEERAGSWSKTVYHVDDSPRYASIGRWRHSADAAVWEDAGTWRPLPQRELNVRDDYDVLAGNNRLTVQPLGWVHEQDNLKQVLAAPGVPDADTPYRAREIGVNRYERIEDFDFSAGDEYWAATAAFWAEVRAGWARILGHAAVRVDTECDGEPSFMRLFTHAGNLADAPREEIRSTVERELACIVEPV